MKIKANGIITVYLSLSLFIVISLLTTVIASARDKAMRQRIEMAMDMSLQSIFAEYNRALLENYDLYFIDSSYGGNRGSILATKDHFNEYFEYNLNPSKRTYVTDIRDLYGLKLDKSNITLFSLATDNNADVYKRQAIHYVKDKFGISIIEGLKKNNSKYKKKQIEAYDTKQKREEAYKRLKKADAARDENGKRIEYENPVNSIEEERGGVLNLILGKKDISNNKLKESNIPSERSLQTGDGIINQKDDLNSLTNNLLFNYYLNDKFSCYTDEKNNKGLLYEIEYILYGKESDTQNLKKTVNKLLIIREAANSIAIFQDSEKKAEADLIASGLALLLFMPELEDSFTEIILFAWAFAEACVDVRTLLENGKVPIIKNSNEWVLNNLAKALNFKLYLNSGKSKTNEGLSYKDYLLVFLSSMSNENKIYRSLDMLETNMREMVGNYHFRIDQCIEFLEIEAEVSSQFKFKYNIRRFFGYE